MFVGYSCVVPVWQDLLMDADKRDRYGYCRGVIGQVAGRALSRIQNIPILDGVSERFDS